MIAGARVNSDFVDVLERAAQTSDRVVVVGIRGDDYMQNDGAVMGMSGGYFGERSYEAMERAVVARYGSMAAFYEANPNVTIQAAPTRTHSNAGNSYEVNEAVRTGYRELEARMTSLPQEDGSSAAAQSGTPQSPPTQGGTAPSPGTEAPGPTSPGPELSTQGSESAD